MLFCLCFLSCIMGKGNIVEAISFQEHKAKIFFITARRSPYILKLSERQPELFRGKSAMPSPSAANHRTYKLYGKQLHWHLTPNIMRGPILAALGLQH